MERNPTLPRKLVLEIRRLATEDKMGVQAISDKFDLKYFTVYSIVRGWTYKNVGGPTLSRRTGQMTPEKAAELRKLRKEGASIKELVEKSDCCRTTVKKALAGDK